MRDSIETFSFIKKYHQDLDATLRELRESKRLQEHYRTDRPSWEISHDHAMTALRDIGRFMLGIEQPRLDLDFADDPFTDIGRQEVERKVAKQQKGEVGDDLDKEIARWIRVGCRLGWMEPTDQFDQSPHTGKLQRVFRVTNPPLEPPQY